MIRVVVLNWHDYLGRGSAYVQKIVSGLERTLNEELVFYEVTEVDLPSNGRTGWWNKLSLFDLFDDTSTKLYLDLDVLLCAPLDPIIETARQDRSRLWMRDDFSYSLVNPRDGLDADFKRLLGGNGCCNSSVMVWHARPDLDGADDLIGVCHGDQNVLSQLLYPHGIGLLPNESVKSFKYHPGEVAPVVVMHGSPKNHEVMDDPLVAKYWR